MMTLVKCISIRESMPGQIIEGQKYWVDNTTEYKDSEGTVYVRVYADKDKKLFVGILDMSHFKVVYRNLRYGLSLCAYINTAFSCLLKDIIQWCVNNANAQLASCILAYINDNELDTEVNQYKEYYVKSYPLAEFMKQNKGDEYMKYLGFLLECAE